VLSFSFDGKYSENAIYQKLLELGLSKEEDRKKHSSSSALKLKLPAELPSVEDTLKKLSAALKALETPGLDKSDVLRLRGIIAGCKVYKELFADYIDYRGLEAELLDGREGKICGACEKVPDDSAQINCLMSVSGFVKMWLVLKKWLQGRDSNPNLLVKNHFWSHYEYVFTKQSEFKAQRLIISSEPIGQRNFARQDHPLIKEFNYSAAEAILNMRLKTKSLAGSPKWRTNLLEKGTATGHRALGLKASIAC
jgi:hypothetical protein